MKEHELEMKDFILDEIESIELIGDGETIDITVDDTHMFYCNDIYTHNSSIKSDVIEGDQMGGSIKKAQIGHFLLSVAKSLEQRENGTANIAILKSRFGKSGIVLEDVIFDNGTVQIDMGQNTNGTSFLGREIEKEQKGQDRVKQIMELAQLRKRDLEK